VKSKQTLSGLKRSLRLEVDPVKAAFFPRFFKSGPGEYGEGDKFLGVTVPKQRAIAKMHKDLALADVIKLLHSPWHEERLTALFILVLQFQKGDGQTRKKIYSLYLTNTKYINNWDLVDSSAPYIMGEYLFDKDRLILYKLAVSSNLWEKRIAILSTAFFIKQGQYKDTLSIAKLLLNDSHDLIHKAVGWMLREVGNKDKKTEVAFLDKYAATMPRTMLRYAIEKFPLAQRQYYMAQKAK